MIKRLFSSIQRKLLFAFSGSLLVLAILMAFNYVFNLREMETQIKRTLANQVLAKANEMDVYLSSVAKIPLVLAKSVETDKSKDEALLKERMLSVLKANPDIYGTCVAYEPNTFYPDQKYFAPYWWYDKGTPNYTQLGADTYVYWEWDWYSIPKKLNQQVWSPPYYDAGGGETLMTTSSVPFKNADGSFAGIVTIDVSLQRLDEIMKTIAKSQELGGQAHAVLVDRQGQIVGLDDFTLVAKDINELSKTTVSSLPAGGLKTALQTALADQSGVRRVPDPFGKQGEYFLAFTALPKTGWSLVILTPADFLLRDINQRFIAEGISAVLIMLVLLGLVALLARRISQPIALMKQAADKLASDDLPQMVRAIQAIADGDLTVSMNLKPGFIEYQSSDEVGAMASSFNRMNAALQTVSQAHAQMTASLTHLIRQVVDSAQQFGQASEQLAAITAQVGKSIAHIASTIQDTAENSAHQAAVLSKTTASVKHMTQVTGQVSQGAQDQAAAISTVSDATTNISTAIQQVNSSAQAGASGAGRAAVVARGGAETVQQSIQGMENIRSKVDISAQKVKEMGERSNQIGAILSTIDEIASQTNLLALNAAIEAARAGEHGKGFAIVADEVRKLAERSGMATKEIGVLVQSIQTTVTEAVAAMNEGSDEVVNGVGQARQAGQH